MKERIPRKPRQSYFVTCAPGLEPTLHGEIRALRLAKVERQVGGVYFEGDRADAMLANLELRTAVRVLERVARFRADDSDALYEATLALEWRKYLKDGQSLLVAAHTKESALDHTLFIEQRVKDAICDGLRASGRERPSVEKDDPDLRVHVHIFRDRCTLLVDTSGESLHKRGWRSFQGKAPLSETLAAGLVLLSGWDRRSPVIDPFCGSGTLLVEAALIADDVAPGLFRKDFGFQRMPDYDAALWTKMVEAARKRIRPARKMPMIGLDARHDILEGAEENLLSAGLEGRIEFATSDARETELRPGWNGLLLTNPPYGERVGEERDLVPLYKEVGNRWRKQGKGYSIALFSGNPRLDSRLGIEFKQRIALKNGSLECELLVGAL
ncbi:MAG: putative N6-adenine-specific DNA methylase [Candidatus Paceibacteria bacterium]|jgi:putative N6-adenine-specific DNA methylase